jgi:hypothetical protein
VTAVADPVQTRRHPFFKAFDWEQLENKQVPPPMMPRIVEVSRMDCEFQDMKGATVRQWNRSSLFSNYALSIRVNKCFPCSANFSAIRNV